jgi:hypothetical protein
MDSDEYDAILLSIERSLKRIADGIDRAIPPPLDRSKVKPAGEDALSRPTLKDQAQWEKDDEDEARNRPPT